MKDDTFIRTPTRILLVEDTPTLNLLYQTILERAGHTVHAATTAEEGLKAFSYISPGDSTQLSLIYTKLKNYRAAVRAAGRPHEAESGALHAVCMQAFTPEYAKEYVAWLTHTGKRQPTVENLLQWLAFEMEQQKMLKGVMPLGAALTSNTQANEYSRDP